MNPAWVTAFVAATTVTLVTTPLMRQVARRTRFFDQPLNHKSHGVPVPYLGGVAIAAGVIVGFALAPHPGWRFGVVALIATSLCAMGLLDDYRGLPLAPRLGVEVAAAVVTLAIGLRLDVTGMALLDGLLTVLWIVGLTNATNFLDNMDGLAAGVAASIATSVLFLSTAGDLWPVTAMAAAVAGACLGFLVYNKRPAGIYMGDAGSLFLGYLLAVITIAVTKPLEAPAGFAVPMMLTAVPLADTTMVVLARLRRGRSIAQGGQDHLSHRLVRRGFQPGPAVGILVAVSFLIGLSGSFAGRGDLSLTGAVVMGAVLLGLPLLAVLSVEIYEEPVTWSRQRSREADMHLSGNQHNGR